MFWEKFKYIPITFKKSAYIFNCFMAHTIIKLKYWPTDISAHIQLYSEWICANIYGSVIYYIRDAWDTGITFLAIKKTY